MNRDERLSHYSMSLLKSYWYLKSAKEYLDVVYSVRTEIQNEEMLDAIKQLRPKITYFNSKLQTAFREQGINIEKLGDEEFEIIYEHMDKLDELMKDLKVIKV